MEFERVRKLKYKAAKDIFYNVLNTCYNFTYNSWYYCFCRKFCGCLLQNGEELYCFICQMHIGYDIQEIEKIKNLSTIINVYDSLKKDIKKCIILNLTLIIFGILIIKQLGNPMERLDRCI